MPTTKAGPQLLGRSEPMRRLLSAIDRVARFATGALVLGESGSGKELIARALHERLRRRMPFIAVNCATLGKDLLENELFGHEKGAFTGAHEQKPGLFEMANGGTLFLDEVGEMNPATQAKLLRVLERSEFRRVGGLEKLHVEVSVVAATNRDLRAATASGRFREDLYYRLKVVTLTVPPLRDRREDIPLLVSSFLAAFNARHGMHVRGVSNDAMVALMSYDWPGNVRELKNVLESAAMLSDEPVLPRAQILEALNLSLGVPSPAVAPSVAAGPESSMPAALGQSELRIPLPATLADVERRLIEETLRRTPNKSMAAQSLGIGLRTLYTKLHQWNETTH